MKNGTLNYVLCGLWIVAAVLNIINRGWIVAGYNIIAALYFLIIGVSQTVLSKKGDEGILKFRKIQIAALIFLFAAVAILTIIGLR